MTRKIEIEKDPLNEIPVKVFEQAVLDVANAMKKLSESRLNRNAILALVKDSSGWPKSTIGQIMDHLEAIGETYLK